MNRKTWVLSPVISIVLALLATACSATPAPTSTPVDSSRAAHVVVQEVADGLQVAQHPLFLGLFVFDPAEKKVGSPGGIKTTSEVDPIPLIMLFGHGFGGSMYADYADVILDVSSFSAERSKPIGIAQQVTADGIQSCMILM